jgi:mannose-6-phosphate isomerase-like protein (cupin superfamily)
MIAAPLTGQVIGLHNSAFVMAEWADPGAPEGPPRLIAPYHVHYTDDEAWYVMEGTLAFQLGDQQVQASAGTAVFVPRGVPHTYWNPSSTQARYLLIMTPTIRELINALHNVHSTRPGSTTSALSPLQLGSRSFTVLTLAPCLMNLDLRRYVQATEACLACGPLRYLCNLKSFPKQPWRTKCLSE